MSYSEDRITEIKNLIEPYLKGRSVDLVQLDFYRQRARHSILRILVDKPEGGISLDECAVLNQGISALLDNSGIFLESYILEVSSPGLDRPLKSQKDFLRALDKKLFVILLKAIREKNEFTGVLKKVEEGCIYLAVDNEEIEIPLENVNKAKYVI